MMDEQRVALLEYTRTFWQARSPRKLTQEDARQAVENVTGFLTTLQEWAAAAETSGAESTETTGAV
jgi:hypothetical protein